MPTPKMLIALLVLLPGISFSQNKQFPGTVSSEKTPLIGVTVQIKNSKTLTVTKDDGSFSITAPADDKAVLVFSYVGYETKEMTVTAGVPVNVQLKEEGKALSDVV